MVFLCWLAPGITSSNLKRFISEGADLVAFSGVSDRWSKLRVFVRSPRFNSAAALALDLDILPELWDPP